MPRDLFEDLESWESEQDQDTGSDPETPATAPAADGVAGFSLEALAAGNGKWADLAAELLELKADRERRGQLEAQVADAEVAIDAENADLDDPALQPALLALAAQRRAEASESYRRNMQQKLKRKLGPGATSADVADDLAQAMKDMSAADAWIGEPTVWDLPEYRSFKQSQGERVRAEQAAIDIQVRTDPSYVQDLAAAESDIAAIVQGVLTGRTRE